MSEYRDRRYRCAANNGRLTCLTKPGSGSNKKARNFVNEYTNNSTIHGVKYLGSPDKPWQERLWWILVFIVSITVCGGLITNTFRKWISDPVIVTFSQMATPVWHIPFPAVTICPTNFVRQTKFNFTDLLTRIQDNGTRISEAETKKLRILSLVCLDYNFMVYKKIKNFMVDFTNEDCYKLLSVVAPDDDDIFDMFFWKKTNITYITHVFTEVGLCFSFNLMSKKRIFRDDVLYYLEGNEQLKHVHENDWSPEKGFRKEDKIDDYPFRTVVGGTGNTLELGLTTLPKDYDFLCEGPFQGYNIILHTPVEVPLTINGYIRIPSNQETVIMLKPNMLRTNNALRSYDPLGRQCYYETERYLRFFRVYTQRNCEMECITNYTLSKCGCTTFYLPRLPGTKICGPGKKRCYLSAMEDLDSVAADGVKDNNVPEGTPHCNCLPSCSSLMYDAEISYGDIGFKNYHRTKTYFASGTKHNMSYAYIVLFFKEDQFISLKRAELFGVTDFLANCGGLLGLFMGVSLLSFVEIFYFCTIHVIYRLRNRSEIKGNDLVITSPALPATACDTNTTSSTRPNLKF